MVLLKGGDQMMTWTDPPVFKKGKSYELYRQEILAWAELTDLPKCKQGIVIALSLPEVGETHIREIIFAEITLENLKTNGGLTILLNTLDKYLRKDGRVDRLDKYEDFESFERKDGQNIQDFISMYDFKYRQIERKSLQFTSDVLAFRLLKKANITRTEKLHILAEMNFDNMSTLYEQAKKALIKFKDCLGVSSSMSGPGLEPEFVKRNVYCLVASKVRGKPNCQLKRETWNGSKSDYTDDFRRLLKSQGFSRKKINPSGADGQILKCLSCGSFRQLLDKCPDSWENINRNKTSDDGHVKTDNIGDKQKDECKCSKVFAGKKTESGVVEELTAMVNSLKDEITSLKEEIEQIKTVKNTKLERQSEEPECPELRQDTCKQEEKQLRVKDVNKINCRDKSRENDSKANEQWTMEIKESGKDGEDEQNSDRFSHKKKEVKTDYTKWHAQTFADKTEIEKNQRIRKMLALMQMELTDHCRQYFGNIKLSAMEIAVLIQWLK